MVTCPSGRISNSSPASSALTTRRLATYAATKYWTSSNWGPAKDLSPVTSAVVLNSVYRWLALLYTIPSSCFSMSRRSGVDPELRQSFWGYFRTLNARGVTIVVSSHVMDEADRCDRLGLMRTGKVLAVGTPAEIREQGASANLEEAFLTLSRTEKVAEEALS